MEDITSAVETAQNAFERADKNPLDHGHAFVKGLDGRTTLVRELKKHPAVDIDTGGYHGTTAHVRGISRYASACTMAYREFLKELEHSGFESAEEATIWSRRD